jgi:hypothetical protein
MTLRGNSAGRTGSELQQSCNRAETVASSAGRTCSYNQCGKQTSRGRCQPIVEGLLEGGTVQRWPEALWRSRIFFFGLLSSDQFSYTIYVWGRLCTHFEAVKVIIFASCLTFLRTKPLRTLSLLFICIRIKKGEDQRVKNVTLKL